MASPLQCGTPFSRAHNGFLVDKGECGTILSRVYRGYLIEIEEVPGGFKVRRPRRQRGLRGGGGPGVDIVGRPLLSIEEEDEEIFLMVNAFLQYYFREKWL